MNKPFHNGTNGNPGVGKGDRGFLSCPRDPPLIHVGSPAVLGGLHKAENWWFKGEQDHAQLLHLPLPIAATSRAGAGATPVPAGGTEGTPRAGSALRHQWFTGENLPLRDCFSECLTPERISHITELEHLISTDESVTACKCTAGGGGLYLGEYMWEKNPNICWPFQDAWMGFSQFNLCLFHYI